MVYKHSAIEGKSHIPGKPAEQQKFWNKTLLSTNYQESSVTSMLTALTPSLNILAL